MTSCIINIISSCHVIPILVIYSFWQSLRLAVSPPLVVLRRDIAPVSCFVTLSTDVLMVVTVFLILNHFNNNHANYKT